MYSECRFRSLPRKPGRAPLTELNKIAPVTLKPIEDVSAGDWVYSWDFDLSKTVRRVVSRTFRHRNKAVLEARISHPHGRESIVATPEHPFWKRETGWRSFDTLVSGDLLQGSNAEAPVAVLSPARAVARRDVFNFEVRGLHNYLVGVAGVLVHNSSTSNTQSLSGSVAGLQEAASRYPSRDVPGTLNRIEVTDLGRNEHLRLLHENGKRNMWMLPHDPAGMVSLKGTLLPATLTPADLHGERVSGSFKEGEPIRGSTAGGNDKLYLLAGLPERPPTFTLSDAAVAQQAGAMARNLGFEWLEPHGVVYYNDGERMRYAMVVPFIERFNMLRATSPIKYLANRGRLDLDALGVPAKLAPHQLMLQSVFDSPTAYRDIIFKHRVELLGEFPEFKGALPFARGVEQLNERGVAIVDLQGGKGLRGEHSFIGADALWFVDDSQIGARLPSINDIPSDFAHTALANQVFVRHCIPIIANAGTVLSPVPDWIVGGSNRDD